MYNALNESAYQNVSDLESVTIENAVYVAMKNDLAFIIAGTCERKYLRDGTGSSAGTAVCRILQWRKSDARRTDIESFGRFWKTETQNGCGIKSADAEYQRRI